MADALKTLIDSARDIRADAVAISDCMISEIGKIGRSDRLLGWLVFAGSIATAASTFVSNTTLPWLPAAIAIATAVVAGLTKLQAQNREQRLPRLLAAAKSAGTVEVTAGSHLDMWGIDVKEGRFELKAGIASRDAIKITLNELKADVAQLGCEPQYVKRDQAGVRNRTANRTGGTRYIYYEDAPFYLEGGTEPLAAQRRRNMPKARRVE